MKLFKLLIVVTLAASAVVVLAQQAQVSTKDATNRDATEARLVGEVSFGGAVPFGQAFFEYGRNELYGRTTPQRSITAAGEFTEKITGLNEDTGYHFRAVLVSADNTLIYGEDKTFITQRIVDTPPPATGETGTNDTVSDNTNSTTGPVRPADGDTITDESGASCLGVDTIEVREGTSGPVTGYRCPTDEDTEDSEESGTDVGIGTDTGAGVERGGIGSLITTGESTTATGRQDVQLNDTKSEGIVACGRKVDNPQTKVDETKECDFYDVIATIQEIISFLLYFSILIFVGLMTWAGFKYMTAGGSMDATKNAKKMMLNGLVGMAIIAFAWLGVNTILGILTDDSEIDTQEFLEQQ